MATEESQKKRITIKSPLYKSQARGAGEKEKVCGGGDRGDRATNDRGKVKYSLAPEAEV